MRCLLLLDYDGTLTPIRKHPKLAHLSLKQKLFLKKLARRPEVLMAVISGRKLSDIKRRVGIRNIIYVGNHGYEIFACGKHWIHPVAKKFIPRLKKIKALLKNNLRYRGVHIENKGLTLSVHYRLLPKKILPAFNKLFARTIKPWPGMIKITHGKKVLEIRPPVDWDKGKAVKWVVNKLGLGDYWPVYIGDDKTDEDAFRVINNKGMTIHVGGGNTSAKMRIKNINGVYRYLRGLIKNES